MKADLAAAPSLALQPSSISPHPSHFNLHTLFEKFDLFADAPDAVAKMRGLLTHFAVSGELVPNEPRDKPVALSLSGPSPEDEGVPPNWRCGLIGDVFTFEYGDNLPAPKRTQTGEYPVYGSNGIVGTHDTYLTKEPAIVVGRKGSAGALNISDGPSWATDVAYFVRPPKDIDLRFTYYLFSTLRLDELGKGIKPGLSRKEAYALPIALPPLAEQKRIVAKVDELMALCDRLEAQQQERETRHAALARASLVRFADAPTPANLQFLFHSSYTITPADLRKSILTLAVQGKLTQPIDSEGIGSDILNKAGVSEERTDSLPELPAHWVWARLGSLVKRMDSGWSPACIPEPAQKDEWGVLKTTAVQTLQYQEDQNKFLPPNLEPRPENEVMDGDILFTRAGPMNRVGILCVARPTRKKLMISDKIIRFHLVAGIDPDFAALSMNAGHSRSVVEGLKSGMAASQVNISQPKLRSVPIPIPPLAEQRRIVAKVEQLMALVDALETQLGASRATAANLLAALVAELTTQT